MMSFVTSQETISQERGFLILFYVILKKEKRKKENSWHTGEWNAIVLTNKDYILAEDIRKKMHVYSIHTNSKCQYHVIVVKHIYVHSGKCDDFVVVQRQRDRSYEKPLWIHFERNVYAK